MKNLKMSNLDRIVWETIPTTPIKESSNESLHSLLSETEKVEANKNKLDLKPNVDFVSKNKYKFEQWLSWILQRNPDDESIDWSEKISFSWVDNISFPQVSPEECKKILARMPKVLIELSKLQAVDYKYSSFVPLPDYDEKWNLTDVKCKWFLHINNFPGVEHPSRILIWYSDGINIYPTPIPKSVSEDERASYLYQVHVFLHEFFHTIDYPRRKEEERSKVLLSVDNQQFTFQDWWLAFEELILSWKEPQSISSYANSYSVDLNENTKAKNFDSFTNAIAEQICETFVAYQLGIISNNEWWTDFKKESFWNLSQLTKQVKWQSESANLKWILMDKLCRASVVK